MDKRTTMADIARRAGVHVTTVSLALRNHPRLPLATRERIQALAAEMNYRPDPAIASLVAYRHAIAHRSAPQPLGYVTGWDTQWGWRERGAHDAFYEGAKARALQLGFELQHFWLRAPEMTDKRMVQILDTRGINGLIFASHSAQLCRPLDFDWSIFSAVQIDYLPAQPVLHRVSNDQRGIVQLAMRRTAALGYRRIGLVIPRWWDDGVQYAWSAGYFADREAITGLEPVPVLRYPWPDDSLHHPPAEPGIPADALASWWREHRPDVILSHGPLVMEALEALGLRVPEDVAFVDLMLTRTDGAHAGVRHNSRRVGELAVEILSGQLQHHVFGVPPLPTVTLVEGTWFDGASLPAVVSRAAGQA